MDAPPNYFHSKLHDLINDCEWEEAKKRLEDDSLVTFNFTQIMSAKERQKIQRRYRNDRRLEVEFKNDFGYLPLHLALSKGAPLDLVRILLSKNRDAINEKWLDQSYPLHIACAQQINENQAQVIKYMMKKSNTLTMQTSEDSTPLHLLCEHNPPIRLIKKMFKRSISSINLCSIKDNQGRLPIHVALDYTANSETTLFLLEQFQESVRFKQFVKEYPPENNLPIHIAVSRGCSEDVLKFLLSLYPGSIEIRGEENDTPLHLLFNEYEIKFTNEKGKSKRMGNCDAEQMMRLMIQYYFRHRIDEGCDRAFARKEIKYLLVKKEGHFEEMSVTDLMKKTHRANKLPHSFRNFIQNILDDKDDDWDTTNVLKTESIEEENSETLRTIEYYKRHGMGEEEYTSEDIDQMLAEESMDFDQIIAKCDEDDGNEGKEMSTTFFEEEKNAKDFDEILAKDDEILAKDDEISIKDNKILAKDDEVLAKDNEGSTKLGKTLLQEDKGSEGGLPGEKKENRRKKRKQNEITEESHDELQFLTV